MNVLKKLESIFHLCSFSVSERIKIVEGDFKVEYSNLPSFEELNSLLVNVPTRDTLKLFMKSDSEDIIRISSSDLFEQDKYDEFKELLENDEVISVSVSVEKVVENNKFSIYSFSSFTSDLLAVSTLEAMSSFSHLLEDIDYLTFELLDQNYFFSTNTMAFVTPNGNVNRNSYSRSNRLNTCRDTSYFFNANDYKLLPEDFYFNINFDNNPLTPLFERISTILSLVYISSTATISDHYLKIQIAGQRSVDFSYLINNLEVNKELYKIYCWIYTDGSSIDKAVIARNIISLHCRYADLLDTDGKTFASIQSNFNLYLKNNVTQYLDVKNKLAEFICDVIAKTGDHVTQLLSNLKSNLIAIFIFLFTVILTNIVSDQPLQNIFTRDITAILEMVLLGSFIYLFICIMETNYKLKKTKDSYTALKENYESVFSEDELKEVFNDDKLINDTVKSVNRGKWAYTIVWGIFLLLLFVILESMSSSPIVKPYINKFINLLDSLFT
ncbi:hypothetical protein J40TS1_46400 [Paenibacillus montaniterrae]|uniref:Uncharacterized protein n=1 Tax=Paenibacillus montaniterrae TaxID=429341 RepID=A0A920D0X5_9BACL|nr:hypothetical protein [Paenibacillus montaniterrae]GIP18998.1 hypothetical protein J40TS1_46400 [Paenibacillus montaniterrae]